MCRDIAQELEAMEHGVSAHSEVDNFFASSRQPPPAPSAVQQEQPPRPLPKPILRAPPPLPPGWELVWDAENGTAFYMHESGVVSSKPPRLAPLPSELKTQASAQETDPVRPPAPAWSTCAQPSARQVRGFNEETRSTDTFDKMPLPAYACAPQAASGNLRDIKEGFAISFPEGAGCEADPDIKDGICRGVMAVMMKAPWRPTIQQVRVHVHAL